MKKKIKTILTNLEETKENLLSLSDDIWLSIDHNDTEAMQEGVAFKGAYNTKLAELDRLSAEISVMLEQFTGVHRDEEQTEQSESVNSRIIKELNTLDPHSLDEDFMYKKPTAFVINGQGFDKRDTWRNLFITFMQYISKEYTEKYNKLATAGEFVSKQGNSPFSTDGKNYRVTRKIGDVYAELNLSANSIRDVMKKVVDFIGIDHLNLVIYLREDRDFIE